MEIKDYLHFYIGQKVLCEKPMPLVHQKKLRLSGIDFGGHGMSLVTVRVEDKDKQYLFDASEVTLVLRHVSTMSAEDKKHDEDFVYLLKQGFDLFGLIDAELAIDNKSI